MTSCTPCPPPLGRMWADIWRSLKQTPLCTQYTIHIIWCCLENSLLCWSLNSENDFLFLTCVMYFNLKHALRFEKVNVVFCWLTLTLYYVQQSLKCPFWVKPPPLFVLVPPLFLGESIRIALYMCSLVLCYDVIMKLSWHDRGKYSSRFPY